MSNSSQTSGEMQAWATLYRQAFARFGSRALWNVRELAEPTPRDALVIARKLRIEGNLPARQLAELLESTVRADL